jgi:hypothetical protein
MRVTMNESGDARLCACRRKGADEEDCTLLLWGVWGFEMIWRELRSENVPPTIPCLILVGAYLDIHFEPA